MKDPDAEIVENLELLERLELLDHFEVLGAPAPSGAPEEPLPEPPPGAAAPLAGEAPRYLTVAASIPQAALRSWPPE